MEAIKYRFRRNSFSLSLLKALAISGMFIVAASNPRFGTKLFSNVSKILRRYNNKKRWKKIQRTLYYLRGRKFVYLKDLPDGKVEVRISSSGQEFVKVFDLDNLKIEIPEVWDKKLRLVIFDIPVHKHKERNAFLRRLKELGLFMVQKSIWVHPYDCTDEIVFLRKIFEVEPYVKIVLVDAIEGEYKIRRHFNLT